MIRQILTITTVMSMGVGERDPEDLLEGLEAGEAMVEMMEHLDLVEVVVDLEEADLEVRFYFTIVPRKKNVYQILILIFNGGFAVLDILC